MSGKISVNNPQELDYEANKRLRLIVIATGSSAYGYTTVWLNLRDQNDNPPRFTQERYTSAVWEGNDRGTYVTQIIATDEDEGLYGVGDLIYMVLLDSAKSKSSVELKPCLEEIFSILSTCEIIT